LENIELYIELLTKANEILKHYDEERTRKGLDFNIFSILDIERREVLTHSNMIFSILNPKGDHKMGDLYLEEFLQIIGISESYQNKKWTIYREYAFDNGRIDFLIKSSHYSIVIEMKVDAGDQDKQLARYEEYALSTSKSMIFST